MSETRFATAGNVDAAAPLVQSGPPSLAPEVVSDWLCDVEDLENGMDYDRVTGAGRRRSVRPRHRKAGECIARAQPKIRAAGANGALPAKEVAEKILTQEMRSGFLLGGSLIGIFLSAFISWAIQRWLNHLFPAAPTA